MRRPDAKTAETTMERAVICNPVSHMRREIAKASWSATKGWGAGNWLLETGFNLES
jgi:hypothetical protein